MKRLFADITGKNRSGKEGFVLLKTALMLAALAASAAQAESVTADTVVYGTIRTADDEIAVRVVQ